MARPFFLHVGLPRTATTTLQGRIFPSTTGGLYLGKQSDNSRLPLAGNSRASIRDWLARREDPEAQILLRRLMTGLLRELTVAAWENDGATASRAAALWKAILADARHAVPDRWLLQSDEALLESCSGKTGLLHTGDGIPLLLPALQDLLEDATLIVTLRTAVPFLIASYYKTLETIFGKDPPMSFATWVEHQLRIRDRAPLASRIFLAQHRSLAAMLRRRWPDVRFVHYESLVDSAHPLDLLLGFASGETPLGLQVLARQNATFRNPAIVDFMLSAPGVPARITAEAYVAGFEDTLARFGLIPLFEAERFDTDSASA